MAGTDGSVDGTGSIPALGKHFGFFRAMQVITADLYHAFTSVAYMGVLGWVGKLKHKSENWFPVLWLIFSYSVVNSRPLACRGMQRK